MYIKVENGNTVNYSLDNLKESNPQISFPSEISDSTLSEYSVYKYTIGNIPSYDPLTETLIEGYFEKDENDKYHKPYVVRKLSLEDASNNIRNSRNKLLANSDWLVIKRVETSTPLSANWEKYRQELRDITSQDGFPYAVIWPIQPE